MKELTMELLEATPVLERQRIRLGMTKEEFLKYFNEDAPREFQKMSARLKEFMKDRISEDGRYITKFDPKTHYHITYDRKTGEEVGRKHHMFSLFT